MTSNAGFHASGGGASQKSGDDLAETIARPNRHAFGDGSIASAETYEDIAILVLGNKRRSDARQRHAVYTLLCRSNFQSELTATAHALQNAGPLSSSQIERLKAGVHAPIVFYVGQSSNVIKRLYDHAKGRGGFFTQVFSPYEIVSIDWYSTEREARKAERETAQQLDEANEVAYVGGGR